MSSRRLIIPAGFRPDGVNSDVLSVRIQLELNGVKTPGYVDGRLVIGAVSLSLNGQSADVELPVNADIKPRNTVYRTEFSTANDCFQYTGVIPAGTGDVSIDDFLGWV